MEIKIGFFEEEKKRVRKKGKNIIAFLDDCCVVDLETTGLSPEYDTILEMSALRIRNGEVVEEFTSLIKPSDFDEHIKEHGCYIWDFITKLTGITDDMIKNAPSLETVLKSFLYFVADDIIVGHNVNFDINFIYDYTENLFEKEFNNDFVDTMRISRYVNKELEHNRLKDLAEKYNIDYDKAHRSLVDCNITFECYKRLKDGAIAEFGSVDGILKRASRSKLSANDIKASTDNFDVSHPLYGKNILFTGTLEKMPRREAMQIVADLGGICQNGVNKHTNYLVLANTVYKTIDGKSSKQKKAEELKEKGNDIEIIPEDVFYDLIEI